MKKYLTALSLLIATISFGQTAGRKVVVKAIGAITKSQVSDIVKDSIAGKADDNSVLHLTDTAAMLSPYAKSSAVNGKVNITDTSTMLSSYLRKIDTTNKWISPTVAAATYATITNLALKANDNAVIHLTNTETVTGLKTFNNLFGIRIRYNNDSATIRMTSDGIYVQPSNATTYYNGPDLNNQFYIMDYSIAGNNFLNLSGKSIVITKNNIVNTNITDGNADFSGNVTAANLYSKTQVNDSLSIFRDSINLLNARLAAKRDTSYYQTEHAFAPLYRVQLSDTSYESHIDTLSNTKDGIVLAGGKTADGDTLAKLSDVRNATGNQDLESVTANGNSTSQKITVNNLRVSGIQKFDNDSLAYFIGNLRLNDVYKDSSGFLRAVSTNYQIGFNITNTDTSHQQQFQIYSTGSNMGFTIDWGDGTTDIISADNRFQQPAHKYASLGTWPVSLHNFNDSTIVQTIDMTYGTTIQKTSSISYLHRLENIQLLYFNGGSFSTDALARALSSIALMPNLTQISFYNCGVTSFMPTTLASGMTSINLANNLMDVTAVNNFLVWLDSQTFDAGAKELDIRQITSAPPSGAGATAVTSLTGKGWIITHD